MTNARTLSKLGFVAVAMVAAFFVNTQFAAANSYDYRYQPMPVPYYQYQTSQPIYYNQQQHTQNIVQLQAYLKQLQQQLLLLQQQYQRMYGHSYGYTGPNYYNPYHRSGDYDIDVDTERARDIYDDEATLYGDIDLDDAPYAYVWFEYGENGRLNEDTKKIRVTRDGEFDIDVEDLDEDERYYFRAVAEDPNRDRSYGEIKSFEADSYDSHDDDEPDVETGDADDVTDDSAEINGEVDMNDFEDGIVFFVYGEDEHMIEDVEDEDRYSDVDEDGDDLQKYKVYTGLDGSREFWLDIYGLDDNTDYYYRICVEYEDEDDDEVLMCGDVEHFETD